MGLALSLVTAAEATRVAMATSIVSYAEATPVAKEATSCLIQAGDPVEVATTAAHQAMAIAIARSPKGVVIFASYTLVRPAVAFSRTSTALSYALETEACGSNALVGRVAPAVARPSGPASR